MVPVIDLFAGPGGMGEGFSSLRDSDGNPVFQTVLSVECDQSTHRTLRMRAFFRKLQEKYDEIPLCYFQYLSDPCPERFEALIGFDELLWKEANAEAVCAELVDGDDTLVNLGRKRLEGLGVFAQNLPWVLIGGPPCQAYSLVGRSRRANDKEGLESDVKQTLYKCYLAFIKELKPDAFVMENVKGLLSASLKGESLFARICNDMNEAGYDLFSLVKSNAESPRDYVVRAEDYGIPQKRHRVILLGVKKQSKTEPRQLEARRMITLHDALKGIPAIRSEFSRRSKAHGNISWKEYISTAVEKILKTDEGALLHGVLQSVVDDKEEKLAGTGHVEGDSGPYEGWFRAGLEGKTILVDHSTRSHQASDLDRYLFCAAYAKEYGKPAHITDFPAYLYPKHKNVSDLKPGETMKFSDRFRVQLSDSPSTTITSHIAKDGHYYIHPDPSQCRSLSVREAARLQTFPDNYFFDGNRTSQYTQIGNAVPPLLAQQIAKVVASYFGIESYGFSDEIKCVSCDLA